MSISSRILDRFQEKTAGMASRSDLFIADLQPVNDKQCTVLIGYAEGLDVPTIHGVEEFLAADYGNQVVAQTSSMRSHPEVNAVSVLVQLQRPTRPMTDASGMIRVRADAYLDDKTQNIWQVVDDGSVKFLARQSNENIADIIEARKSIRQSRREATFKAIRTAAPILAVGDHVRFLSPQGVALSGEVVGLSGQKVSIKANGTSYSIDKGAVFDVVERSSKSTQSDKTVLEDYFAKAWGSKELARGLTKGK